MRSFFVRKYDDANSRPYQGKRMSPATITVPFVPMPQELLRVSNERDALRTAAAAALARKAAPLFESNVGVQRGSIYLPPGLHARIDDVARRFDATFQDAFAALVRAGIALQMEAIRASTDRVQSASTAPFKVKDGLTGALQAAYWRNLTAPLSAGRVVLAEGSTGLGKGRVIVAAAIERAIAGAKPVYVAAPTLKVLGQLWREFETLQLELPKKVGGLRARFLPGISEFADPSKIAEYLRLSQENEECVDAAVKRWFEDGGPILDESPAAQPLQRALLVAGDDLGVRMNFLMEDLRAIANDVEPVSLQLEDGEDPRVKASRESARGADIVFCTHAMLALLHKGDWASQTRPQTLLIDEAHEFERNVASVYSQAIALRATRRQIIGWGREGLLSASAAAKASSAIKALEQAAQSLRDDVAAGSRVRVSDAASDEFWDKAKSLELLLKSRAYARIPGIKKLRTAFVNLQQCRTESKMSGWVEFSPKRAFPSIVVGLPNIGGVLGRLWQMAHGGVGLCSATLLVPDENGNPRAEYLQSALALPKARLDVPPAVIVPSVFEIPIMHRPSSDRIAHALARPTGDARTDEAEAKWLRTLGRTIGNITTKLATRGGTLVLLTSFAQVRAIAEHIDPTRLIMQGEDERFADAQNRFEQAYRAGGKPVLLGVGTAWTGVDLADKAEADPKRDMMLADLIIGCLPIGLNRSATMQARIERMGTRPIEQEALMMLRQGLGRLIRREGVQDRHIWFLDGRLWTPWRGMDRFTRVARNMLTDYKHQAGLG